MNIKNGNYFNARINEAYESLELAFKVMDENNAQFSDDKELREFYKEFYNAIVSVDALRDRV